MISRYTRTEMGRVWSPEAKFKKLLEVEVAVARAQSEAGLIPKAAYRAIKQKGKFSVSRIDELEKETKHDVIAFVSNMAENVGPHGQYVHYGLTSSDVLDTATSLLFREAHGILSDSVTRLRQALEKKIKKYNRTPCVGRTHGIHAEPTTFGFKLSGFLAELKRNQIRLDRAIEQVCVVKLSGPVGTHSTLPPKIESEVGRYLKLKSETYATQVVPRDRHAEVMLSLALLMAGVERLAVELRHLQRTEVSEVEEGFSKGQKGSSAMPHKKNPIGSENITGLSRLVKSYVTASLENVVLWHERDISHSSVERVIFPDSFIVTDYACDRMAHIVNQLVVNTDRMKSNLLLTKGQIYSSKLLLALVKKGLSREEAYKMVQRVSHSLKEKEDFLKKAALDSDIRKHLRKAELSMITKPLR